MVDLSSDEPGTSGAALDAAIAAARRVLLTRFDGHLPRPARFAILDALGPVEPEDARSRSRLLASAALVERALPIWQAERPLDDRPAQLLRLALTSPEVAKDTSAAAEAFDEEVMDLYNVAQPISNEAGAAAHAAVRLVAEAALGLDRGPWPDEDDHEDDAYGWGSAYLAEIALTSEDPAQNREARHALWTWWLDEAVPAAAQAGRAG